MSNHATLLWLLREEQVAFPFLLWRIMKVCHLTFWFVLSSSVPCDWFAH